jgi:hypothetical protein
MPAVSDTTDATGVVESISAQAAAAANQCDYETPYCLADVLDNYAAALERIAPLLPPRLRVVPSIIARAASQVRESRSRAEAVHAVKAAIAEVHKTIALIKADDPVTRKIETRESALVVETLRVADNKLEKAVGL